MNLTTVSVAMAVCNGERFLAMQLDSILSQLDKNDELIISYDSSKDRTFEIACGYAERDSRIVLARNSNPGIVSNFNNALSLCRKDSVFISDQDDLWLPGKREVMLSALNGSGADLAIHNFVQIDSCGQIISAPQFETHHIGNCLLRNFAMPRYSGCCMAFPHSTLDIIMPMPESVINYDHWIGMACEVFGKVEFVDDVLLGHRLHGSNVTTSRRPLHVILSQRASLLKELIKRRPRVK